MADDTSPMPPLPPVPVSEPPTLRRMAWPMLWTLVALVALTLGPVVLALVLAA